MSINLRVRVNTRALGGAVLAGAGLSLVLGVAYLAGGAARTANIHAPTASVAIPPGVASGRAQATPALAPTPAALRSVAPEPAYPTPVHIARAPGALDCLTDAVYYEARGESAKGQAAVAQVVLNRVRQRGFPNSVCGVVFQGAAGHACQFSFTCNGAMHEAREPVAWRRARAIAQRALDGFVMEEVGDATSFHVARLGQIWGSGLVKVAQVGAHVFYKLTGHGTFVAHSGADRSGDQPDAQPSTTAPAEEDGQASLILASAVTSKPLGEGGPAGPVPEPASAPAPAASKPVPPPPQTKPAPAATAPSPAAASSKADG